MPLFVVQSRRKENIPDAEYKAARQEHLRWQFETEASGRLFAERQPRAHAESDPYHAREIRDYTLHLWTLNESSFLGMGFRATLNGDDPSNPKYRPPAAGAS